jgi:hypothetical protein
MRLILISALLVASAADSFAGPRLRNRYRYQTVAPTYNYQPPSEPVGATPLPEATASPVVAVNALAEVNAARARRGLPAYLPDEGLEQAAQTCALLRAQYLLAGHTANDFAALPQGTAASAAGCGALEPSWGWGSCCTYDNYRYAGAAVVTGRDGRRFMHLFVR